MRIRGVFILAMVLISAVFVSPAAAGSADLTANELAEVLGVQWWIFSVPADAKPGDTISVHWVTPSGMGSGAGLGVEKPGEQVKIFYWPNSATQQPLVRIVNAFGSANTSGLTLPDGFVIAIQSGIANGSAVKSGDILVKLGRRIPGVTSYSSDGSTTLKPNEIGLKVEIEPKRALAAAP